jgi:hypothetical protein
MGLRSEYVHMSLLRWTLALIVGAGLGMDAYTHLDLASTYSHITTGTVNQGVLFQIEAVGAILAGALVLARPNLLTAALATALAGGGAGVLLLYRYVQVGKIGPVPDMSEPLWYTEKVQSLVGELVAAAAGAALVAVCWRQRRVPNQA